MSHVHFLIREDLAHNDPASVIILTYSQEKTHTPKCQKHLFICLLVASSAIPHQKATSRSTELCKRKQRKEKRGGEERKKKKHFKGPFPSSPYLVNRLIASLASSVGGYCRYRSPALLSRCSKGRLSGTLVSSWYSAVISCSVAKISFSLWSTTYKGDGGHCGHVRFNQPARCCYGCGNSPCSPFFFYLVLQHSLFFLFVVFVFSTNHAGSQTHTRTAQNKSLFIIQCSLKKKCTLKIFIHHSIYSTTTTTTKAPTEDLHSLFNIFSRESIHTEESKTFICLLVGLSAGLLMSQWVTDWLREEMINWFIKWLTDLRYCLRQNIEWVIKKKIYKNICSSRHL